MKWMSQWKQVLLLSMVSVLIGLGNAYAEPEGLDNDALEQLIHDKTITSVAPGVADGDDVGDLIMNAMGLLGVAYRFGGNSPVHGLDCSGFMQYIFRKTLKVNLPRTAAEMAKVGKSVRWEEMQPGDLVFFSHGKHIGHVGMYIGDNRMIHAPRTGKNIEITNIATSYWKKRYVSSRRIGENRVAQFLK